MRDLLLMALAVALLVGATWLGERRWLRPRAGSLGLQARGLLGLIVLTLTGGFLGSLFWWTDQRSSFSWDLPPLASRMLAAASWAFVVAAFLALERPSPRRIRVVLVLLAAYLAPLVLAALLFHRARFDFAKPITYAFFAAAGGMAVTAVWYLLRQPAVDAEAPADRVPAGRPARSWLTLVATVTAAWGAALFATDDGPWRLVWVWPGDLLTSRLIAVMLLAIAAGALAAIGAADSARMMLAVTATYGAGVVAANLWGALDGKPVRPLYLIVFGALFLGSAALLAVPRARVAPVPAT